MDKKYNITYTRKSLKFLEKLSKKDKDLTNTIIDTIEYIANNPYDSKKLKGQLKGLNRIQVGKYRVIFKIYKKELVVLIVDIGRRANVYS